MKAIFAGKTILVTGHTGFKGSWLSLWLQQLDATVVGFSLPDATPDSLFALAGIGEQMIDIRGDLRDFDALATVFQTYAPDMVFHLAAQPIVLDAYQNPKYTFDVNTGGTVNVLEAVRLTPSVKAALLVTSDKCYDNREWAWGYRENDALGGDDPYSASKCMAEYAIAAYRRSFCHHGKALASARAGNVIGGGDYAAHRILPDCLRALSKARPIPVRHPHSIRAFLYHLDCLYGYLLLAANLLSEGSAYAEAWNFGPQSAATVQELVEKTIESWGNGEWIQVSSQPGKEKKTLRLNWEKAADRLGWTPLYSWQEAVEETVYWHKQRHNATHSSQIHQLCLEQIATYRQREACKHSELVVTACT